MSAKAKIGILGASGYTGAELVRLLLRHPQVDIVLLTADRRAGKAMADVFPQFPPYPLPTLDVGRCRRLAGAGPRSGVLRAAAWHHADRHQGFAGAFAGAQDRRSLRRFPPRRSGCVRALVRPRPRRARAAAEGGVRPDRNLSRRRSRRRSWSPTPAATPAVPSLRSSRCCRPRRSIPTRSSSTPNPA